MRNKTADDFRVLVYRVERYLRLAATDKLTVLTTCVALGAVMFALATSAIFFLSTGAVKSLTLLTGDEMVSYYAVGAVLVLAIVLVYLFRKPLIEKPMVRKLSRELLEGESLTEQFFYDKKRAEADSEARLRTLARSVAEELGGCDEEGGEP